MPLTLDQVGLVLLCTALAASIGVDVGIRLERWRKRREQERAAREIRDTAKVIRKHLGL